ncbi:hypothetical protein [Methylomonas sp. AM2-LC]|uniref:hypothetical protein n=1 Tax=Methylomonas sp. AM2-LC TaxID=3153301 RepID=UPI00326658D4
MIDLLFDKAKGCLSTKDIKSLASYPDYIEMQSESIADTLDFVAMVIADDSRKNFISLDKVASILWGLSYRARDVAKLTSIASEAEYLLSVYKDNRSS